MATSCWLCQQLTSVHCQHGYLVLVFNVSHLCFGTGFLYVTTGRYYQDDMMKIRIIIMLPAMYAVYSLVSPIIAPKYTIVEFVMQHLYHNFP